MHSTCDSKCYVLHCKRFNMNAALKDFRFYKIMLPGFAEKLLLPCKFSALYMERKGSKKTKVAILACPNGKTWHVDIYKHMEKTYIGGEGWETFRDSNNIKLGYFLLFHYEGNFKFNIKAFNLKLLEVDYADISMENVESDDEESGAASMPTNERRERGKRYSRFKITMEKCHLQGKRNSVHIPSRFTESNGLEELSEVTLRDPEGMAWKVGLYHGLISGLASLSRGWLAFLNLDPRQKMRSLLESKLGDKMLQKVLILVGETYYQD